MIEDKKIDHGGHAFPIVTTETNEHGLVFPFVEPGMTLRQYYAAHCPMTMREAYETWRHSGNILHGLSDGMERRGFLEWWAIIRFEYADAMIATRNGGAL